MNTRILRTALIATAVMALTIGACKKKPKDDKAKTGDMAADVMKPAAMDAMKPAMAAMAAMKPAMKVEAMKPAGMDVKPVEVKGPAYTIKFDRPLTKGLKYKSVANGVMDMKTLLNGKPLPPQTFKMTYVFEAEVTVKGVHASGKATEEEIKIIKLQMTKGGATKDLLPKDTIVLAKTEGGKEKFSVKGKQVPKATGQVLGYVIDLFDGDPTTTDEVFGPGGPKKVGETWKPNAEKLLSSLKNDLKKPAIWPKVSDVAGKVTFVAAKKVAGMDVFEVAAKVKINNIAPSMGPVKATAGSMEIAISGWMPKDSKIKLTSTMNMTMKMHVEGGFNKGGKDYKMVMDIVQSQKGGKTLIK